MGFPAIRVKPEDNEVLESNIRGLPLMSVSSPLDMIQAQPGRIPVQAFAVCSADSFSIFAVHTKRCLHG